MKTAKKLGIKTVAIYSEVDKDSLHVQIASDPFHVKAFTNPPTMCRQTRHIVSVLPLQPRAMCVTKAVDSVNADIPQLRIDKIIDIAKRSGAQVCLST